MSAYYGGDGPNIDGFFMTLLFVIALVWLLYAALT